MRWIYDQRGTSTLEFIVVLPTLLIIFLGSLELSRAWLTTNVILNAAREGARVAAVSAPGAGSTPTNTVFDSSPSVARINEILTAANLTPPPSSPPSVTCTPPAVPPPGLTGCSPDSQVQATVTINFQTVVPLFLPMLANLQIVETARMRRE
jgi:Flp pilus assembly protein TadG